MGNTIRVMMCDECGTGTLRAVSRGLFTCDNDSTTHVVYEVALVCSECGLYGLIEHRIRANNIEKWDMAYFGEVLKN